MRNTHNRPGLWQENWKMWKMKHKHNLTCNMARNTHKLRKWVMQTIGTVVWHENENNGNWETHTAGCKIWRETLKNMETEKCTL